MSHDPGGWESSSCFKGGCSWAHPPGTGAGDATSKGKSLVAEVGWAQPAPILPPRALVTPCAPANYPGAWRGHGDTWVGEQSQAMAACFPVASCLLHGALIAPRGFDSWF